MNTDRRTPQSESPAAGAKSREAPDHRPTPSLRTTKFDRLHDAAGCCRSTPDDERQVVADSTANLVIAFRRWCKRKGIEPPTVDEYRLILDEAARTSPPLSEQEWHRAWTKCADCGVLGRKHPATGDHPFRPEKLRAVK